MEQITLDLIPKGSLPVLHASQYDDGRQWKVNLKENGEDYTLTDETIVLGVRKGDGCAVTCAVAIESGKKYVILTSTEQMCAVAGQNLAELQITKGSMKIGTLNFILQVERDPLNGSISSSSEIHDLQHQVDECVDNALADLGASGLPYDNTESGLEATNVQQAIDEVNEKTSDLASDLDDKADKSNTYTKSEVNDIADTKADANNVYTKTEVDTLINNLPEPMIFKGTLGVNGTITELPTASASNEGYTYKVITEGTYAGTPAKVGDVFVSDGSAWVLIPAGDEDNDTWRAIKVNGVEKLGNAISSGSVDFVDTTNVKFEFDSNGNAVKATLNGIDTSSEVDAKVAGLIDDTSTANNKAWSSEKTNAELASLLPVDEVSGAVANFDTDVVLPLIDVKAEIKAVETGTGAKSPSNPYVISGFTGAVIGQQSGAVDVAACFRGLFKGTHGFINLGSFTWNYSTEGSRFATTTTVSDISLASNFTNLVANGYHTISSATAFSQMQNLDLKRSGSMGYINIRDDSFGGNTTNFKNAMNSVYLIYELATSVTPTITPEQYQALCTAFGIDGTTYTFDFGQTVYGGELDVTNGKVKAYAHYTSYDGETLSGEWLSSMDTYAAGTTPTVGAEVVDLSGAVYTELDITPQEIMPFVGINNLWNDTNGDTTVKYKLGIQKYIDAKLGNNRGVNLLSLSAPADDLRREDPDVREER